MNVYDGKNNDQAYEDVIAGHQVMTFKVVDEKETDQRGNSSFMPVCRSNSPIFHIKKSDGIFAFKVNGNTTGKLVFDDHPFLPKKKITVDLGGVVNGLVFRINPEKDPGVWDVIFKCDKPRMNAIGNSPPRVRLIG
jgi:hypothetical protein